MGYIAVFAEKIRGDDRQCRRSMRERRSQTGSFVLAALIGNRGALTVSNLHSDKGGEDSFPARVTASSLIANRASEAGRFERYARVSRGGGGGI